MTPDTLQPGITFANRYRIERQIGIGGTAEVFRATDNKKGRPVALKVFLSTRFSQNRIQREAQIQGQLQHHHILKIHRTGETNGISYLDLELAQGDFRSFLQRNGKLPLDQAISVISDATNAVAHTHKQSYLHRELKPSSLLYAQDGSVRIGDWGSAIEIPKYGTILLSDQRWGLTPGYCDRDQFSGKPTIQSDIYALGGLTAFSLLTGSLRREMDLFTPPPPFAKVLGTAMNKVYAAVEEPLRKALSESRFERQTSMEEYHTELTDAFKKGKEIQAKARTTIS